MAVEWATNRVQFGERIFDFQGVSFPLADSAADASAARLLTREAAALVDAGADPKVVHAKASLAKLFASEAAFRCADRVVQVFGGRGYMRENAAERFFRELRVDRIWEGTSEIQRLIIARPSSAGASTRSSGEHRGTDRGRPSAATRLDPPPIDLRPLFAPRSIAVVGASARGGIAETVAANLRVMGSATRCHFVNPRYDELYGQPCYPSLDALPEVPDTVMVAVNPLRATSVVEDAARVGVPSLIIPGGGVVEGGEAAAQMQREVAEIARANGIALLGPNCMGMVDLTTNAATYIGDINPWQPRGGVAGIAQSGSVTDAFIHSGNRIGFSRIIGCGSEVVLDACDFLAYCLDDPETHAVILFLEGFKRPERFLALADRALELDKPIMVVKVGRSAQAQAAAIAHSGSLAGEDRATDAALRAAGVIRCDDLDELLETAELVAGCRRLGRRVGRGRTGVVTVSTGEASLIADLVPRTGVDLPPVPPAARDELLERLPTLGYIGNPLDPWGATDPPTAYGAAFDAFADSGAYDVLALVHDFPYRSLPSEVETAREVTAELLRATADRPDLLPGLRLADVRRADAGDQGAARRGGRRADAARRGRGVPGDRVRRGRGSGRRAPAPDRRPEARGVAGPRGGSDAVGPRAAPATPAARRAGAAATLRAGQPRAPCRGRRSR